MLKEFKEFALRGNVVDMAGRYHYRGRLHHHCEVDGR